LKLSNTLTKTKDQLKTVYPGEVRMYSCGPTVYDYFHIGNARPFIVFDVLRRYLEYKGYKVKFVQNFTDIDDKMIDRANKEGITVFELADRFIAEYYKDADALGIMRATHHPRATEHISDMIAFIEKLVSKGFAYQSGDDVYFDTSTFSQYGKLSGQNIQEISIGARVEINENKKSPFDFVLWKGQKPGEPAWDSPWGMGRPGWHIECSVMATAYLGETIDIHSGGQDLIFPHHENEIAQSEGASGKPFANIWLHNGFVSIDDQKMSKSLGNFFTVREIMEEFDPEVIRLFMLSAHYRKPVNFSRKMLEQAENALERLYNLKRNLEHYASGGNVNKVDTEFKKEYDNYTTRFEKAMDDDLNTAEALAVLFDMVRDINSAIASGLTSDDAKEGYSCYMKLAGILGLLSKKSLTITDVRIKSLVEQRQQARADKDWALADRIREELRSVGVILEDTPQGVRWRFE
jgi:cysteinyl-tRNA synthetase